MPAYCFSHKTIIAFNILFRASHTVKNSTNSNKKLQTETRVTVLSLLVFNPALTGSQPKTIDEGGGGGPKLPRPRLARNLGVIARRARQRSKALVETHLMHDNILVSLSGVRSTSGQR